MTKAHSLISELLAALQAAYIREGRDISRDPLLARAKDVLQNWPEYDPAANTIVAPSVRVRAECLAVQAVDALPTGTDTIIVVATTLKAYWQVATTHTLLRALQDALSSAAVGRTTALTDLLDAIANVERTMPLASRRPAVLTQTVIAAQATADLFASGLTSAIANMANLGLAQLAAWKPNDNDLISSYNLQPIPE